MPSRSFEFEGARGQRLAGRIELPPGPLRGHALFAHCFSCTKDSLAAVRVARALAERGIAVLRFDFAGLGDSEGAFSDAGFSGDVGDLIAAAAAMADAGMPPALLVGHSLGGAAVLAAAGEIESVRAIATIGAPFDLGHVTGQFGKALPQIMEEGEAEVTLGGRSFTVRRSFVEDLARHDMAARIAGLKRPLLILHAPLDEVVGIEQASAIYSAARHPKSFLALDGANHLLTRTDDAEFVAAMIAAWACRYLPDADPAEPAPVTAELTGAGKFQTRIGLPGGAILADEPQAVGGDASGPTPYELLSAGLAACTAMTIHLYAARKTWKLPRFHVAAAHSRSGEGDLFTRDIVFEEALEEERAERLIEIADKCPVHRTLQRRSEIATLLTSGSEPQLAQEPPEQHFEDMKEACGPAD